MKDEVFDKFIENIYTREDLSVLLDQIEEAMRWVYKGGEVPLSEKISGATSEEFRLIIADLEEEGKFPTNLEDQATFFKRLKKYLEDLPTIKITLAFAPSKEFLADLASFLQKEVGQKAILEIIIKEELVGGAIVEYNGEYRDYSLARKLDEVIESSKLVKTRPEVKNDQAS
jgi:hypothetical protein